MNLLKTIIERLNQRVEVANIFDQIYPLCELNANGNDKAWVHYIGNGQAEVVTNFDAKQGTLFWAKRGKVSVVKTESFKVSGCKTLYQTTFPLTAYAVVRKSHLPCDSEDSQDWIASRIYRLISGTDPDFKVAIGVIQYEVIPNGYVNEIKSLTANYEWACVAVDVDVSVVSSSEDGCYDVCSTGDIPLPDFQPCTPCLTEVAVDGVTITGNGTIDDPLVAVGGGGGGSIVLQTDGVNNGSQSILNLKEGTNITLTDDGVGGVTIDASGGGLPQSLQEVTDVGNTTTNDISFGVSVGAIFNNGAKVKEGTTDAGLGGAKGVAMICSNAYELKWEAGRLYYMEQNGFTIREVTHNFTITPLVTDDSTKGFVVGSRWTLDNGDLYICSDDTIGAAVWNLQSVGGVTNVTATAPLSSSGGNTPDISIQPANLFDDGYLTSADFTSFYNKFDAPTGLSTDYLDGLGSPQPFPTIPNAQVNSDWNAVSGVEEILNKPTIPTATSDLTNDSGFITIGDVPTQVNSDWNATTGFAEILNKPTIPVVTGFVPYTGATADLDMGTHNVTADHIALNVSPSGAGFVVGATEWNNTIGSSQTLLKGGNVTLKNGVDLVARIVNKVTPNTTLTKASYQAVRVSGATGGRLSVALAKADSDNNSADTLGLVCETIATNQEGFIITAGQLSDINTTGSLQGETWADGDVVYLSPTTAGRLTNIKPTGATGHIVVIGYIEYSHASQGSIYVKIMNGWELDELHNIFISSPSNNDALIYESSTQLWKNKSLATALGYTPVTDARTISTTAPLSGGGDLTANRTLSIADAAADGTTKGAATFTANDFNATSGVISIDYTNGQAASGSTKGFLTSANWTTFNGKQDALTSGTNIKTINSASILGSGNIATPFELVVAASDETTALTTGTAKITFRMPRAITLTSVRASLTTAQASGSIFTIDINESGTSILSTKLTIDNTETTSTSAATPPVISDVNLADDSEITIDIDQIGNGTAKGLKVMLIGNYV